MKRRYFVKSILFLLLTAMVLLSVTVHGGNAAPEDGTSPSVLKTEETNTEAPTLSTDAAAPSEAPSVTALVPAPETEDPEIREEENVGDKNDTESDSSADAVPSPTALPTSVPTEDPTPTPVVTPAPKPQESGPLLDELYPCPPEIDAPIAAEDPAWEARIQNASVYTAYISKETFRNNRNQPDTLKLTADGLCELDVLFDNGWRKFDFYSMVPAVLLGEMELHIRHKGTYTVSEAGEISAVFDRCEAYVVCSPLANAEYRKIEFEKMLYNFPFWPYYARLFSGKAVDLCAYKDIKKVTLTASVDGNGGFSLKSLELYNGSGVMQTGISCTYEGGKKVKEYHVFYSLKDGKYVFSDAYELRFNKFGIKVANSGFRENGTLRSVTEVAPDGMCYAVTYYNEDGSIEGYENPGNGISVDLASCGRIEDYEKEDGTRGRRIYDKSGTLIFERELNAKGDALVVTCFKTDSGVNCRYDCRYEYDTRSDCVRFEEKITNTENGKLTGSREILYTYDARGHMLSKVSSDLIRGDREEIRYDEKGRITKEELFSGGRSKGRTEYIYENGPWMWVECRTYDSEGRITQREVHTYQGEYSLLETAVYDGSGKKIAYGKYDENGALQEEGYAATFTVDGRSVKGWLVTYYNIPPLGGSMKVAYDENWNKLGDEYDGFLG